MEIKKYNKQMIHNANTLEELETLKTDFLNECEKREKRINVSNLLSEISNFGCAKAMFESMIPSLMSKKEGKKLIKNYVQTIKENKSLKTIYSYYEGLNENKTPDTKKTYIVEALTLGKPIHYNEYVNGVGKIIDLISESFKILGDDFVLKNVSIDNSSKLIGESLVYLSTTKKTVKNLNEYFSHIDNVCDNVIKESKESINLDKTLEDLVSEMHNKESKSIDNIFNTDNKKETFNEEKNKCLNMLSTQIKENSDKEVVARLVEMETKLNNKNYNYDTFTKDMLYMNELQEVLK